MVVSVEGKGGAMTPSGMMKRDERKRIVIDVSKRVLIVKIGESHCSKKNAAETYVPAA